MKMIQASIIVIVFVLQAGISYAQQALPTTRSATPVTTTHISATTSVEQGQTTEKVLNTGDAVPVVAARSAQSMVGATSLTPIVLVNGSNTGTEKSLPIIQSDAVPVTTTRSANSTTHTEIPKVKQE